MSLVRNLTKWLRDYSVSVSWSIVLGLLILKAVMTYVNLQEVVSSSDEMKAQYEKLLITQRLLIALDDAETGQRGYLITMQDEYLVPFLKAQDRINTLLNDLREKSQGSMESLDEADRLEQLIIVKMKEMKAILELRRWQGFDVARKRMMEGLGKKYMDEFRDLVRQRGERQKEQLASHHRQIENRRIRALAMLIAGSILIISMVIGAFALVRRQLKFRNHMESQLRQVNAALEHRVAQRTEALLSTNEKLQDEIKERIRLQGEAVQAAESLQRSNRELEQFAAVASHDLQEPLRKIQAFSDRLTTRYRDKLDDQGKDYVERIQYSASRMRQLIEDLLAYSRVSTKGKAFQSVDLNQVVKGVVSDLEARLQETNAEVNVGSLPTIEADEFQMRQLFQNLLGNSLKFHRADVKPLLHLNSVPVEWQSRPGCQITLTDNGIGFEQQYADRIFQLFQRLHGKQEFEGTGMGLAICKKIVERHQGRIEAFGEPNAGARFVIHLPLKQSSMEA